MAADTIFADGTMYRNSKLDMINECLLVIGEVPLQDSTIVDNLPLGSDADIAKRLVENTMLEVQSRGWFFNMDYMFTLMPDVNGFISVPASTLRADFGNGPDRHQYVLKNGNVYDNLNHTYVITKNLQADMIWLVDYNELPVDAYNYISYRAARKFQQRVIGAIETDKFTSRDEVDALNNLMRLQLQTQDYNLQNSRVSTRLHNGYLVKSLYGNKGRRDY